jgi:outer membrane protein
MNKNVVVLVTIFSLSLFSQKKVWTIDSCIQHAMDNNLSINQNELKIEISQQREKASKGQFLPNVFGNVSHNFNFANSYPLSEDTSQNTNLGLTLSQTIFNGFKNTYTYQQASLNVELAQVELFKIKDDISLNIVNSYLGVLLEEQNIKIAEAQVNFSEKQLDLISKQVEVGARPEIDVYDIKAALANDKNRLVSVKNRLIIAKMVLTQILQLDSTDIIVSPINEINGEYLGIKPEQVYENALLLRNEILLAEKQLEVSNKNVQVQNAAYMPTLSARYGLNTGAGFYNNIDDQNLFIQLDQSKTHTLGLSLNVPIFNQYATKCRVSEAKIIQQQKDLAYKQEKLNLRQNIERSLTDLNNSVESLKASEELVKAQTFAMDNAKKQLELGAINVFDLEQIRNRLINAQISFNNTKFDFIFKQKVLEFYSGKSLWNLN